MTGDSRRQPINGHTPTPWVADPDWREGYSWNIHIVDGADPNMRICFMTSDGPAEANATLIVEAVNSHDALKARITELEAVVGWVDSWVSNPVGAYSVYALDGLFRTTREKISALSHAGER